MGIRAEIERTRCAFRANPRAALVQLLKGWVSISLVGSLTGTVFDLGVMALLVQFEHFNPAAAAPCGVAVGATVNFAINKIFSFKDSVGRVQYQYLRFAGGTAVAAAVHAGFVDIFTNHLGIHYVISKILADLLVFTVGNLVLLRLIVFPKNRALKAGGAAPR